MLVVREDIGNIKQPDDTFGNINYLSMRFSLPNMPVVIFVEFRDGLDGDEAITEMDEHTATIVLHSKKNLEEVLLHEVIHAVSHQLRRIGIEHIE